MLHPILAVLRGNKNFIYTESREFKMGTVHLWELAIKNNYNTHPGLPIDSRHRNTMFSHLSTRTLGALQCNPHLESLLSDINLGGPGFMLIRHGLYTKNKNLRLKGCISGTSHQRFDQKRLGAHLPIQTICCYKTGS